MASPEENDSNLRSSRPRKLDSPFTEEDLFMRETEAEWEANLVFLEAESPFMHAFEQGRSTLVEPEELEGEFTEEEWTEDNFSVDEAETQVEEGLVDWEDDDADLEDEHPFYTEQENSLFENRELLEEASPAEKRENATDFVPLPVEQPGGGRIRDKRDPPPGDLETIKGVGGKNIQLHRLAAAAWRALLAAARRDGIREPLLLIVSGYRDTKKQAKLYQDAVKRYGSESEARKWVAPPGGSPHHSGRAIDFYLGDKNSSRNVESLHKKQAYLWLTKYARQFGFYPYEREPWHWEYNPPASGRLEGTAPVEKPSLPGSIFPAQPKQQSTAKPTASLVIFAQRVLNAAEGERLGNDGSLGPLTSAALERFRKKYSLGTGGTLDASTVLALVQRALEELAQASMFARMGTRDARTEQAITTFKAAHQLGTDSGIDSATLRSLTDALSRMAPKPASTTMPQKSALTGPPTYLGGKLWTFEAKTLPIRVAVFCPPAALSKREVEVLVFAHGLLNGCRRPKSIPDGIVTDAPFKLGNIVSASNRPIILVVPYLDWASPGGERAFGKNFRKWHALGKPAHLNSMVAEVLAEAGRVQGITAPSLRSLVIAGHSRAYDFLEPLAYSRSDPQMQQGALSRLSQVWAFDSTYTGNVSNWMSWLDTNPRLRVSIFYEPGSRTGKVGDEFFRRRGGRLAVIHAREGHCAVPAKRLPDLLKSLSFAEDLESEVDLSEAEFERSEADLEDEDFASEIDEDYAPEMYNYETSYDVNVIDSEYDVEFEGESEKGFEPTEEEADFFVSLGDPNMYEKSQPPEPELDALAFDSMGRDNELIFNSGDGSFEFEYEDYPGQFLEQEAYSFEHEALFEPEVPRVSEVVFPSGQSLRVLTDYPEGKDEEFWDPTKSGNLLLDTGATHKKKKLSTNFTVREFTTSGGVSADIARIDPKLVENIQQLRDYLGKSITILSGYRSWKLNKKVYAKRGKKPTLSQHCGGRAVDLKVEGMNGFEIAKAAIDACGPNIGVGIGKNFAHIDVRGYAATWDYEGAQPGWIEEIKSYQKAKKGKSQPSQGAAQYPNNLVRFAQRVLSAAEGERLNDDGKLGELTHGALERFRRKYNLGTGSMLDSKTELALAQRALEEIAQQSIFAQLGVFDAKTEQTLISFKSRHGLGWNTILDAATHAALADAVMRRLTPMLPANGPSTSIAVNNGQVSDRVIAEVEKYRQLVDSASVKYGVDSALIRGLIAAESGGNKDLVAKSGYTGLMQADKGVNQKQPATSIDAGTKKLRDFRSIMEGVLRERGKRYDQLPEAEQLRLLAFAYNAGPVTVAKALKYAAEAGSPERWLDGEHYKRALLFTGAYSLKQAAPSCLKGVSPSEQESRMREAVSVWNHWRLGTKKTNWKKLEDPPLWSSISARLPPLVVCAIEFKHRNSPKYAAKIMAYRARFRSH